MLKYLVEKGLFGKKNSLRHYLQEFDEKKWTPISTQKTLTIGITSIGNFFRQSRFVKRSWNITMGIFDIF